MSLSDKRRLQFYSQLQPPKPQFLIASVAVSDHMHSRCRRGQHANKSSLVAPVTHPKRLRLGFRKGGDKRQPLLLTAGAAAAIPWSLLPPRHTSVMTESMLSVVLLSPAGPASSMLTVDFMLASRGELTVSVARK